MHTSKLAEMNAAATRKLWNDSWEAKTLVFAHLDQPIYMTSKSLYITAEQGKFPFMVSDRTTGYMVRVKTFEEAHQTFHNKLDKMIENGWILKPA